MIIERKSKVNLPDLTEQDGHLFQSSREDARTSLIKLAQTMQIVPSALAKNCKSTACRLRSKPLGREFLTSPAFA